MSCRQAKNELPASYRQVKLKKGGTVMLTKLEIQIIQAMRVASDEQWKAAMEYLAESLKELGIAADELPKADEET